MATLPDYKFLDARIKYLPRRQVLAMQSERLRNMVHYIYEEAPFWRKKFDAAGVKPGDIKGLEDLHRVPFCTKSELQADQAAHPPFGSYVCTHRTQWRYFAATSGTTGRPLRRVISGRDWGYMVDAFQREPSLGPGDISITLGPIDGMLGPSLSFAYAERVGAITIAAGMYDTETKVRMIAELKPVSISGSASYLLHLLEVAERLQIDLSKAGLRSVTSVGEPGAAIASTHKKLKQGFGDVIIGDGYGLTELAALGGGCAGNPALHVSADIVITEIVDPETGRQLPRGEPGEVVFSNIFGNTQPLLRYRTRDISRLSLDEVCPACGFSGAMLEGSIVGRVDDMIWYHGVNVFPTAIEETLGQFDELTAEYQILIDGGESTARMTIRCESSVDINGRAAEELGKRVTEGIKRAIRVNACVELLAAGTLPRSTGRSKLRRVVDKRRDAES
ncbi:MAG: hypothetical protein A3G96_05150 [Gammaproteobacteria bacterium RIFCSPLOWO2_12_FULL_52_10]|nr:MAG: hypothetical protein A3G96_05150 [Gammaproteobacteria bacterium RIFCSPLOWO2_12_FULL_52_10]